LNPYKSKVHDHNQDLQVRVPGLDSNRDHESNHFDLQIQICESNPYKKVRFYSTHYNSYTKLVSLNQNPLFFTTCIFQIQLGLSTFFHFFLCFCLFVSMLSMSQRLSVANQPLTPIFFKICNIIQSLKKFINVKFTNAISSFSLT